MRTVKRRKPADTLIRSFPAATTYTIHIARARPAVREPSHAFPFTERHLQAVWFDPQYRPAHLTTADGEVISVTHPGRWNLEAGPDFLDASLVVGPDRRTLRGDVEVHIHPTDWEHHAHGNDPLYRRVIAHACYWPGRLPENTLPRAAVQIALKPALEADPTFFFENIDVTAYPYAVPPPAHPHNPPPLANLPAADCTAFLAAAGQERLRRKSATISDLIAREGLGQPIFEGVLTALGYQHNRGACRRLARLITLDRLREESQGNADAAYALLLGVAGLMPRTADPQWDPNTRRFIRTLWDAWWKMQSRWESRRLPKTAWRLAGLRPQNHPARRLAAAASLFSTPTPLHEQLVKLPTKNPARWLDAVQSLLDATMPYWSLRLAIGGKRTTAPVALLGAPRKSAIILNVLLPYLAANHIDVHHLLNVIPSEDSNQLLRQTAHQLFGPDHNPAIYAGGLQQQGLLQLFHDFCLPNRLPDLSRIFQ